MDDKPRSSIKRASLKYGNPSGVDAEELQIENDRLKTTVMILTQKLKLKEEDQDGDDQKLMAQIRQLKFELEQAQADLEEKN